MQTSEIIDGLKDLIKDREALIEPNAPQDNIFKYDKAVLQAAVDELSHHAEQVSTESKPFPLGQWNYPEEVPTHNNSEIVNCLVVVQGVQTGIVRVEEAEYRYGEWDISNAWNLFAWNYRVTPENKALTLEQLKCMNRQPIWVTGKRSLGTEVNGWMLISTKSSRPAALDFTGACNFDDYGKTWLAYARKPEGANHEIRC